MPPEINRPPTAIKANKSYIVLSLFTFKKVITKIIRGNNKIILGMSDSLQFFRSKSSSSFSF